MSQKTPSIVNKFHKSIPGYKPSPMIKLSELAKKLAVGEIVVKDESQRFDLKSFKILGASYAMARIMDSINQKKSRDVTFDGILSIKREQKNLTFVTASDGNHGLAVGWFGKKTGCGAIVYLPKGTSKSRIMAIETTGATASVIDGNYDDAVLFAQKMAREKNWILLQDSSWHGYKKIPIHIMQGYTTILNEFISQEKKMWPTHIFVQAGVGSLAAAMLSFFYKCDRRPVPVFVVVEPAGAPCYFNSMKINDGQPHRIHGELETIMAGLSCGQPSLLGWNILHSAADAFIKCSDDIAFLGIDVFANPRGNDTPIISGESGAVTMGLVHEILSNKKYVDLKEKLRLNQTSKILLISTEGNTNPQ